VFCAIAATLSSSAKTIDAICLLNMSKPLWRAIIEQVPATSFGHQSRPPVPAVRT
jgi:hypothetical protein